MMAAFRFTKDGFFHILDGIDHLLFLVALLALVRGFWPTVTIVTAFTAAHSATLSLAALGLVVLAVWWYRKSAKGAQARTMQLVEKAADPSQATVKLVK
jgi:hypothetical protein